MTIRLVILFFEGTFVELLQTESTDKVFWVELFVHGCDTSSSDWFMTACTKRATFGMIMSLTIRVALVVKEAC